jgi:hypothetical protein
MMKKLILLILFMNFYFNVFNQIIRGTVLDLKTNVPIWYASVYFNGTTVGTASGPDGNFIIDITKVQNEPLTISSLGYFSVTISDFSMDTLLIIYLKPKAVELKEVVIEAKSLVEQRKANMELFKNEFLGTSENAKNCIIINENDIRFNYGTDLDTLKAFSSPPILIDNRLLGYRIKYYLDNFEYYRKSKSFFFKWTLVFIEDSINDNNKKIILENRRKNAYLGSRMHFFRTLWADDLKSNGFNIMTSRHKFLKYDEIVSKGSNSKKFLQYREDIYVYYNERLTQISLLKKQVFFNENGYFDELGIIWQGEMLSKRTGDMLPYEYGIK